MQKFDPYHRWLGIPPHEQPPTLYRLLGISDFESDQEVITEAAYRQIGHIKQYSSGPHRDAANRILNELAGAQVTLLDLKKKTQYDISIQSAPVSAPPLGDEDDDEMRVDLDLPGPVVVGGARGASGGSVQAGVGGKPQIYRRRKKRSNVPALLLIFTVLAFIGGTFAYWCSLQGKGQPQERVANNAAVSDPADDSVLGASKLGASSKPEEPEEQVKPDVANSDGGTGVATEASPEVTEIGEASKSARKSARRRLPVAKSKGSDPDPAKVLSAGVSDNLGHTSAVTSVAFSPDGKRVVSASGDMTVKLWEGTGEQKLVRTLKGHGSNVTSVAFSPRGHRVVTGSWDKTLVLWDPGSGEKLRTFNGHSAPVWSVAFSPTGQQVVSGGEDGIKLWDVSSGRDLRSFNGHSDTVTSVAVSPNGRQIVSGSLDGTVKLWSLVSGRELKTFSGHSSKVTSVAFSPEGDQVISGSWDKTLILWSADSGEQLQTFSGHTSAVLTVAFSGNGEQVASGGGDKSVLVWDVDSGQKVGAFSGHTDHLTSVAYSPDGRWLVSGAKDKSVRTWELGDLGPVVVATTDAGDDPVFFDDSKQSRTTDSIATVTGDAAMTLAGHAEGGGSVTVSPNGKWVVGASADGKLFVWDAKEGSKKKVFKRLASQVRAIGFSPDGKWIINGTGDGTVAVRKLFGAGQNVHALAGHDSAICSVAYSPTGKQIVSSDSDGAVKLWEVADRSVKKLVSGFKCVAYSGDGELVVVGGPNGRLQVWSAIDRKKLHTYEGHSAEMLSVAFSADGQKIASSCSGNTVKIWDVSSGEELQTLSGHQGAVNVVLFSSDGDWVASGGADKTLKIWDADTGDELHSFSGHDGGVNSLAFFPDGKRMVSCSDDGTLKIWDLSVVN